MKTYTVSLFYRNRHLEGVKEKRNLVPDTGQIMTESATRRRHTNAPPPHMGVHAHMQTHVAHTRHTHILLRCTKCLCLQINLTSLTTYTHTHMTTCLSHHPTHIRMLIYAHTHTHTYVHVSTKVSSGQLHFTSEVCKDYKWNTLLWYHNTHENMHPTHHVRTCNCTPCNTEITGKEHDWPSSSYHNSQQSTPFKPVQ